MESPAGDLTKQENLIPKPRMHIFAFTARFLYTFSRDIPVRRRTRLTYNLTSLLSASTETAVKIVKVCTLHKYAGNFFVDMFRLSIRTETAVKIVRVLFINIMVIL